MLVRKKGVSLEYEISLELKYIPHCRGLSENLLYCKTCIQLLILTQIQQS